MINTRLMLVARAVIADQRTNNVSAINIIEQFTAISFPLAIPEISVLTTLTRDEGDPLEIQIAMKAELAGETIFDHEIPVLFEEGKSHRNILIIERLVLTQPGDLVFSYFHEENKLDSYQIRVVGPDSVEVVQD